MQNYNCITTVNKNCLNFFSEDRHCEEHLQKKEKNREKKFWRPK